MSIQIELTHEELTAVMMALLQGKHAAKAHGYSKIEADCAEAYETLRDKV